MAKLKKKQLNFFCFKIYLQETGYLIIFKHQELIKIFQIKILLFCIECTQGFKLTCQMRIEFYILF